MTCVMYMCTAVMMTSLLRCSVFCCSKKQCSMYEYQRVTQTALCFCTTTVAAIDLTHATTSTAIMHNSAICTKQKRDAAPQSFTGHTKESHVKLNHLGCLKMRLLLTPCNVYYFCGFFFLSSCMHMNG